MRAFSGFEVFCGLIVVGAGLIWLTGGDKLKFPQLLPPEKTEAEKAADADARAKRAAAIEQRDYLCHLKSVCRAYSSARQECATAGNYRTCMSIKMGDDFDSVSECSNDGKVLFPPPKDMPSWFECR